MKHLASVVIIVVIGVLGSTAYADTYVGNKLTVTQDCSKDPEANILGNKNTITFKGTCTRITASGNKNTLRVAAAEEIHVVGNENTVTVEAADVISTPGNDNTIRWTKGLTSERPKVSNPGNRNKVGTTK